MPSTQGVIRWEAPPEPRKGKPNQSSEEKIAWAIIAKDLRDNQGEWGVIFEHGSSSYVPTVVARIKSGRNPWFRPVGAFEATTRRLNDDDTDITVYARYVGEPVIEAQDGQANS